jgi:hypothetical protein
VLRRVADADALKVVPHTASSGLFFHVMPEMDGMEAGWRTSARGRFDRARDEGRSGAMPCRGDGRLSEEADPPARIG